MGGTLKFYVYIDEADFFGVKILNFQIFFFWFSEKLVTFLGSELFMDIFLGHAFSKLCFWGHL